MKCPKCKKEIEYVNVISTCYQKASLGEENEANKIVDYGSVQEILNTQFIECPECLEKITRYVKE